jgi:uncharacterized SAM-binding protein YcdF (DUF218 family)
MTRCIVAGLERSPRLLKRIIATLLILYVAGFVVFATSLPTAPQTIGQVDGIVALTGGGSRLDAAVALFERGWGERLLISGVNTQTSKRELKKLLHGKRRFDCCADLGYAAENTFGNAKEAAAWTRFHHFRSILIVTSRYHMPRAIAEFRDVMPDVKRIPYPVEAETGKGNAGKLRAFKLLHSEYVKFLAVTFLTAAGLEPGLDRTEPSPESRSEI